MPMEYIGEGGIADIRSRIFKRRGQAVLDNTGKATITFSPAIILDRTPYLQLTPQTAEGESPIVANVIKDSFVTSNGAYVSVRIQCARAQDLPSGLTTLNLVVSLNGRKVTENTSLTGVKVDWLAF